MFMRFLRIMVIAALIISIWGGISPATVRAEQQPAATILLTAKIGKELTDWILDEERGYIYAISRPDSQLFLIRSSDLVIENTISIGSYPMSLALSGTKLYVGLSGAAQIKVVDLTSATVAQTIATVSPVYQIAISGTELYYSTYNSSSSIQNNQLYCYTPSNGSHTQIPKIDDYGTIYSFAVHPDKQLLYVYQGYEFYTTSLSAPTVKIASAEVGGYNFSDEILIDGGDVYFATHRFDSENPAILKGLYKPYSEYHYDELMQVKMDYVLTDKRIYHKDTYTVAGTLPFEARLAAMDGNKDVFVYEDSGKSIHKLRIPLTSFIEGGHTSNANKIAFRDPVIDWTVIGDHMYAISTGNTLYDINLSNMQVDNEFYIGSRPSSIKSRDRSLYISHNASSQLSIVDLDAGAAVRQLELNRLANMLLINGNDIYLGTSSFTNDNTYNATVLRNVYGPETVLNSVYSFKMGFYEPEILGMAVSPEDRLMFLMGTHQLYRVSMDDWGQYQSFASSGGYYNARSFFIDNGALYAGNQKFSIPAQSSLLATFPESILYVKGAFAFSGTAVYDTESSVKLYDLPFEISRAYIDEAGKVYLGRKSYDYYSKLSTDLYKFDNLEAIQHYGDQFKPGKVELLDYDIDAHWIDGLLAFRPAENDADIIRYEVQFLDEQLKPNGTITFVEKNMKVGDWYEVDLGNFYRQSQHRYIAVRGVYQLSQNSYRFSDPSIVPLWDYPTFMPKDSVFADQDSSPSSIGGTLSWKAAQVEYPEDFYGVSYILRDGRRGPVIAIRDVGSTNYSVNIPVGTAIPNDAIAIGIVYVNQYGYEAFIDDILPLLDRMTRTPVKTDITVTNGVGSSDSMQVVNLAAGEKVIVKQIDGTILAEKTVEAGQTSVSMQLNGLSADGGYVTVVLSSPGKANSLSVLVRYNAETSSGGVPGGGVPGGGGIGPIGGGGPIITVPIVIGGGLPGGGVSPASVEKGEGPVDENALLTAEWTIRQDNNIKTGTVTFGKVQEHMEANKQEKEVVFEFKAKQLPDKVSLHLDSKAFRGGTNSSQSILFKTPSAAFTIPAKSLARELEKASGMPLDSQLTITMDKLNSYIYDVIRKQLPNIKATEVAAPVDFKITLSKEGTKAEFVTSEEYWGHSLQAQVQGPFDANQYAGMVYDPGTKQLYPVPSTFVVKDGVLNGTLWRKGNSIYTILKRDAVTFKDLPGDEETRTAIERLTAKFVVNGYEDDTYRPERSVTRAEFAALLMRALGIVPENNGDLNRFPDVQSSDWFFNAVTTAASVQLLEGYEDGTFRPNNTISRLEMGVMLRNAVRYVQKDLIKDQQHLQAALPGADDIPNWALEAFQLGSQMGYLYGTDGIFKGLDSPANRGESALYLYRLLACMKLTSK